VTAKHPDVLCPFCRGTLDAGVDLFSCPTCAAEYPAVLGIPDLRSLDPPYSSRDKDLARSRELAERYSTTDFGGLLRYAYSALHPEIPAEALESFLAHRIQRAALNKERWQRSQRLIAASGLEISQGIGLDLGCGVGGFLPVLAQEMPHAVGVDIMMEELILARKYLEEQSVDNVTLICVDAETVPLAPETVSLANATNVVEHVRDAGRVIERVHGLLVRKGVFVFDSPNRWDLVHPEPHVGIRFVGLWPRWLQEPYVRLLSSQEYKGKHLLSLPELDRLLRRRIPSPSYRIFYWPRWRVDRTPRTPFGALLLKHAPGLVPFLNRVWGLFVGVHEVVVWRPEDGEQPSGTRILPMPAAPYRHDDDRTATS
jgi:SAM-dependent methyltransferase